MLDDEANEKQLPYSIAGELKLPEDFVQALMHEGYGIDVIRAAARVVRNPNLPSGVTLENLRTACDHFLAWDDVLWKCTPKGERVFQPKRKREEVGPIQGQTISTEQFTGWMRRIWAKTP